MKYSKLGERTIVGNSITVLKKDNVDRLDIDVWYQHSQKYSDKQ